MSKRTHVFQVIFEQDEAGYYVAGCPALRACYTQGKVYSTGGKGNGSTGDSANAILTFSQTKPRRRRTSRC